MDTLTEIVRNVVALVLVFSCLELFLPAGELARFVRLACGLILLALIIVPAAEALSGWQWHKPAWAESGRVSANFDENSEALTLFLQERAMSEYEVDAARQIAAVAALAAGVTSCEAAVLTDEDGVILRAEINAGIEPGLEASAVREEISSLLSRFFNLAPPKLCIEIREGA
ncbi:MAG: hypothetical protein GX572_06600 [Clostridia bacterium]|nr:hypothetical protein [Clostridia bacterium]